MATLQKFKHFAGQCGASKGNPTQSPTTSPVIHVIRRRKTLRMLLSRGTPAAVDHHRRAMAMFEQGQQRDLPSDSRRARRKLKDLFVSSPPFDINKTTKNESCDEVRLLTVVGDGGGGGGGVESISNGNSSVGRRFGGRGLSGRRRGLRQGAAMFRHRLLRRAWRPVLVTIPE